VLPASDQRAGSGAGGELAVEFFDDEEESGERGIERGGEPGAGACGEELGEVGLRGAKETGEGAGDGGAHLDGGALAAEGEAGADSEDAAEEFDGDQATPIQRADVEENAFEMRDAAAGSFGCEADGGPADDAAGDQADRGHDGPAPGGVGVEEGEEVGAAGF